MVLDGCGPSAYRLQVVVGLNFLSVRGSDHAYGHGAALPVCIDGRHPAESASRRDASASRRTAATSRARSSVIASTPLHRSSRFTESAPEVST